MIWNIQELVKHCQTVAAGINGKYVPARPMTGLCDMRRLKAAWVVLRGKADVVIWDEGQ